ATVSITVRSVNDAPVANPGSLSTDEDEAVSGTLSASDIDGDPLTYAIVTAPQHGTVTITDASTGAFVYTPAANYNGPDSFTFRASDGSLASTPATVSITVRSVDDAPVAYP